MTATMVGKLALRRDRWRGAPHLPSKRFAKVCCAALFLMLQTAGTMAIDLQGHRGARGLLPENTHAGFARAIELGVTTLETDLAVTRDGIVVLSHDPLLNPDITRGPDGRWLTAPGPAIRALDFAELQRFDVGRIDPGSAYARQFPLQTPVDGARIPALTDLFALAEASSRRLRYNIEIKTSPLRPDDTPEPAAFARLVVDVVKRAGLVSRVVVQSFDWRALDAVRILAPDVATSCLTIDTPELSTLRGAGGAPSPWLAGRDRELPGASAPDLAAATGCRVWSPYWRNLDRRSVERAHTLGLEVLPWTVNDPGDMQAVIALGVDGLITDYPDVARALLERLGIALR